MNVTEAIAKHGHGRAQLSEGEFVLYPEWPQKTTDKDITALPALVLADVLGVTEPRNTIGQRAALRPLHRYHADGRSERLWGSKPLQDRKRRSVNVDADYFAAPIAERLQTHVRALEKFLSAVQRSSEHFETV